MLGGLLETSATASLSSDCNGSVILDSPGIVLYISLCHYEIGCWRPRWANWGTDVVCLEDNNTDKCVRPDSSGIKISSCLGGFLCSERDNNDENSRTCKIEESTTM